MKNKYKRLLIIIVILIIILGVVGVIYKLSKTEDEEAIKVLDVIDGFSYELKETDSKLKKDLFYELEKTLKEDDIDYKIYAELLSKIFVVDVFSLDYKMNKYDIGGLEFILDSEKDKFKTLMSDTLYDIVENNYDGKRKQELPLVNSVTIIECTDSKFKFDNEELLAYDIVLEWTYEKDLGYDTSASVKVVKMNDKMYVVSYNPNI